MATPITDLLKGLAQYLATAGVGTYSSDPTVVIPAGATAITLMQFPPTPDRAVSIAALSQGDDASMPMGRVMIQVRFRGNPNDPLDVENLGDSVYTVLQGLTQVQFGSVTVISLTRGVSVPMGMDQQSQRWGRLDQYYSPVTYAPTSLRPDGGFW
jgi:hypothetical protein